MNSTFHLTQFNVTDRDGIESDDCGYMFDASKFNATAVPVFIVLHTACFIVAICMPMLYFRRFRKQPLAEIAEAIEERATFAATFEHLNKKKKYMYGNTLVSSDRFAFNVDTAGSVESVHLLDADSDSEHMHAFPARQQSSLDEVIGAFRAHGIGNDIVHLILVEYCGYAGAPYLAVLSKKHQRLMRRQCCSYIRSVVVVALVAMGPYVWTLYGAVFLIAYGWCSYWVILACFAMVGVGVGLGWVVFICMDNIYASSLRRLNEEYRNEIVAELRERDIALYAQATTECDTVKADLAKVKTHWLCHL